MIIQQNSMKNLRGHFSRKLPNIGLGGVKGTHPSECGLSNGARIAGFHLWTLDLIYEQVWPKLPMIEWFIQKWRVKDLRLNRLITYWEGRESSYFTSWNRRPSLDMPRFPASSLGHCWRWGGLSNGGSLSKVLTGVKERGRDHWPKKPYFRRFSASWHRKLWPGFPFCSS